MEPGEDRWRDVNLPAHFKKQMDPELERETGERRRGRDIMVSIDHRPQSKHAFDWAIVHLCRMADTLHLVHVVPNSDDEVLLGAVQALMERLAFEAYEVAMVKTVGRIVEGDIGKAICREAGRIKPAALVMGTRGRGIIKSVLQGSVSQYCFNHCSCPVVIVPPKEAGDRSVI